MSMELRMATTCRPCAERFIGPAIYKVHDDVVRHDDCGGCGQTVDKVRVSYWYPWPEDGGRDER